MQEYCNIYGTLHGGTVCTIIDLATSILTSMRELEKISHVTVNLSVSMMKGVALGEYVYILCIMDSLKKSMAFISCEMFTEKGELCYKGQHIKMFVYKDPAESPKPNL